MIYYIILLYYTFYWSLDRRSNYDKYTQEARLNVQKWAYYVTLMQTEKHIHMKKASRVSYISVCYLRWKIMRMFGIDSETDWKAVGVRRAN